jgi:hypothetical protein
MSKSKILDEFTDMRYFDIRRDFAQIVLKPEFVGQKRCYIVPSGFILPVGGCGVIGGFTKFELLYSDRLYLTEGV